MGVSDSSMLDGLASISCSPVGPTHPDGGGAGGVVGTDVGGGLGPVAGLGEEAVVGDFGFDGGQRPGRMPDAKVASQAHEVGEGGVALGEVFIPRASEAGLMRLGGI